MTCEKLSISLLYNKEKYINMIFLFFLFIANFLYSTKKKKNVVAVVVGGGGGGGGVEAINQH